MRPILLIMWTAFQSFILRDNNNDNNNTDSTCKKNSPPTIKFLYAGFAAFQKKTIERCILR